MNVLTKMPSFNSESSSESSGSEESADDDPSSYNRYRSSSIPLENSVSSGTTFHRWTEHFKLLYTVRKLTFF